MGQTTTTTLSETPAGTTTATIAGESEIPGETTTTTTVAASAVTVPTAAPPGTLSGGVVLPVAGTRPTEGLSFVSAVGDSEDSGPEALSPLSRMMASFSTAVELLSVPAIGFVLLAAVVAWLSVKGLERAPGSRHIRLPKLLRLRRR